MPRIVILGAGATGLGAAYRLQELGHQDWDIYEQHDYIGGLATSFRDDKGFTYDVGGHVLFSHYKYYDELIERLLGSNYTEIMRESWIWIMGRFVPYPFQNNIKHLPREQVLECVLGLIEAQRDPRVSNNFEEWIVSTFGEGIAKHFMLPYNFKVWAHPPDMMSKQWMAERVSVVDRSVSYATSSSIVTASPGGRITGSSTHSTVAPAESIARSCPAWSHICTCRRPLVRLTSAPK
jgi:protoporphyrinogen oxidase